MPRHNTKERIIIKSLQLFNEHGERKITTNHISESLSMSPGNLYYHFRSKDEIIMQLFDRYCTELLDLIENNPAPTQVEDISAFIGDVFKIMWKYRFFFTDLNALLMRNPQLQFKYESFMLERISPLISIYLHQLTDAQLIEATDIERTFLAKTFWLLVKHWFSFDKSTHSNLLDESSRQRGLLQVLSLIHPYIAPKNRARYDKLMGL